MSKLVASVTTVNLLMTVVLVYMIVDIDRRIDERDGLVAPPPFAHISKVDRTNDSGNPITIGVTTLDPNAGTPRRGSGNNKSRVEVAVSVNAENPVWVTHPAYDLSQADIDELADCTLPDCMPVLINLGAAGLPIVGENIRMVKLRLVIQYVNHLQPSDTTLIFERF